MHTRRDSGLCTKKKKSINLTYSRLKQFVHFDFPFDNSKDFYSHGVLTSAHLCIYSVMAVDVCQELPISLPTAVFSPFICLALHESVPSGNRAVLHPSYQHSTWLKQLVMFSWGTCGDKGEWDPPRVHMQHMLCFTSVAWQRPHYCRVHSSNGPQISSFQSIFHLPVSLTHKLFSLQLHSYSNWSYFSSPHNITLAFTGVQKQPK